MNNYVAIVCSILEWERSATQPTHCCPLSSLLTWKKLVRPAIRNVSQLQSQNFLFVAQRST